VVTTLKNTVDHVVTEWGIAELRGRPLAERARALIAIAHPDHRDELEAEAHQAGVLPQPGGTGTGGAAPPGRRARPAAPTG
jgi:acyl-CoA hydrolase